MTDTRMVRLEQIAAGPEPCKLITAAVEARAILGHRWDFGPVKCRQIADAAGGDVYEPINSIEAAWIAGLVSIKWPHLVQVEVVNG